MGAGAAIAVLPFDNPSGDPEQGYVARGFVEELVTELSRFPTLEVIPLRLHGRGNAQSAGEVAADYLLAAASGASGIRSAREPSCSRLTAGRSGLTASTPGRPRLRQDEIVARVAREPTQIDTALLQGPGAKPSPASTSTAAARPDHPKARDAGGRRAGADLLRAGDPARSPPARAHAGLSLPTSTSELPALGEGEKGREPAYEHARHAAELDSRDGPIQIILGASSLPASSRRRSAVRPRALALRRTTPGAANAARCVSYLGDQQAAASPRRGDAAQPPVSGGTSCVAVPLFHLGGARSRSPLTRARRRP
jgi:hypothetical protein